MDVVIGVRKTYKLLDMESCTLQFLIGCQLALKKKFKLCILSADHSTPTLPVRQLNQNKQKHDEKSNLFYLLN
jgi:hypothetical protein